jgi:DNA polymerase-3 subunit delta'
MPSSDWPIIGNTQARDFFESLLLCERLTPGSIGGTYIISGPDKVGRGSSIEYFVRRLLGNDEQHSGGTIDMWPDVFRLRRKEDKREIGVDQAREFSARLALSSFSDSYRVGIIHEADLLTIEAANALLKSLEEASDRAIIFLVTEEADRLPQTIQSRSQIIHFRPVATDEIYEWLAEEQGLDRPFAKNIARLSAGRPGWAAELARDRDLLENYLKPARIFVDAFGLRLHERWKSATALLSGLKGAQAAEAAENCLKAWRQVTRDVMMAGLNQPEHMRYAFLENEIRALLPNFGLSEARRLEDRLRKGAEYLKANVNPANVLENILIAL